MPRKTYEFAIPLTLTKSGKLRKDESARHRGREGNPRGCCAKMMREAHAQWAMATGLQPYRTARQFTFYSINYLAIDTTAQTGGRCRISLNNVETRVSIDVSAAGEGTTQPACSMEPDFGQSCTRNIHINFYLVEINIFIDCNTYLFFLNEYFS